MTRGRGAAHAIRLYVEALLAVPPELRRVGYGPPATLRCTLREVVSGLWPRGWQRGRDWPRLLAGLGELARLGVEWEHGGTGGVWFAVTVRSIPRDAALDDLVQFEVLLPPGSGPGPMVAREHLRLLGLDSAPAYRMYLSLCWLWDHYGTRRGRLIGTDAPQHGKRPAAAPVNVGGRLVNPAALHWYPALSPDDLAAMAYAPGDLATPTAARAGRNGNARALPWPWWPNRPAPWCCPPSARTVCAVAFGCCHPRSTKRRMTARPNCGDGNGPPPNHGGTLSPSWTYPRRDVHLPTASRLAL